jgi:hypothetical protein
MKTQASNTLRVHLAAAAALARRKVALALCVALCTVGLAFPQSDEKATIITFDAPGACSSGPTCGMLGTYVYDINPAGAITGTYFDANFVQHGFLRAPDGTFTTFDSPGFISFSPIVINPAGAITGSYTDVNGVPHGYLRAPDGAITAFDAPGACSSGSACAFLGTSRRASTRQGRSQESTLTRTF